MSAILEFDDVVKSFGAGLTEVRFRFDFEGTKIIAQ